MRTTTQLLALLALVASTAAVPVRAQSVDTTRVSPHDSVNIQLLDITVDPNVNEPHRVFLQKHVVYKASFSEPGVTIRMRSYGGKQLPFVVPTSNGIDATGGSEYELYPLADGEVEFTAIFNEDQRPVRFRLWSDARATRRGERSAAEGWWQLGVDLMIGQHPDLDKAQALPVGSGPNIEACFGVRNGPGGLGILNGCIFGIGWGFGQGSSPYFGLFMEPRLRVHGGGSSHIGWAVEEGIDTRFSVYAVRRNGWNFGTPFPALGLYIALDQRSSTGGSGWRLVATGRSERMQSTKEDFGSLGYDGRWRSRALFEFSVGRYF